MKRSVESLERTRRQKAIKMEYEMQYREKINALKTAYMEYFAVCEKIYDLLAEYKSRTGKLPKVAADFDAHGYTEMKEKLFELLVVFFKKSEYVDKFGTEDELAEADIASTFCKEVYELLPLKDLYHNCKKAKKLQNQKNSDRYN